jgi:hypothetical protein
MQPFLLAGPVLRRCTATEVTVWIACSEKIDPLLLRSLDLEVYLQDELPSSAEMKAPQRNRRSLGANYRQRDAGSNGLAKPGEFIHVEVLERLHVYVVTAKSFEQSYPLDKPLAYELYFVEGSTAEVSRHGICEHLQPGAQGNTDPTRVPVYRRGYDDDPTQASNQERSLIRPSSAWRTVPLVRKPADKHEAGRADFYVSLPTLILQGRSDLRVWSGSCLKPHGNGLSATALMYSAGSDSQASAGRLAASTEQPTLRPHAFFQLGDQIYADDVSFLLFEGVKELSKWLTNEREEILPGTNGSPVSSLSAKERYALFKPKNGKTPLALEKDVQNQLLSFSEYCAYYIMCHNTAFWPDLADARLRAEKSINALTDWSLEDKYKRLKTEFARLNRNKSSMHDYSTVLANVPVYSICDDHEVTDDWFFDANWIDKVRLKNEGPTKKPVSAIAKFLIANAVRAYAIFQAIGNDPPSVAQRLKALPEPQAKDAFEKTFDLLLSTDWSFIAPTRPAALFLDTRTQRTGGGDGWYVPASAIYDSSLSSIKEGLGASKKIPRMLMTTAECLRKLVKEQGKRTRRLFLVTPSPVLSSDGIERLKRWSFRSPEELDEELWRTNLTNFFMLVEELRDLGITSCLNLAGDVHYAYRRRSEITERWYGAESAALDIEQIVSSAMLNEYETNYGSGSNDFIEANTKNAYRTDFDLTRVYSRSMAEMSVPENCWVVRRKDQKPFGIAHREWTERLYPLPCETLNRETYTSIIWTNNFVEVSLTADGQATAVFHVQTTGS